MSGYVELHCHSAFSFLDGASRPEELVRRAAELGYPALALTDHDGLYGSMEFARAARAAGVRPITGAELTVTSPFPDERANAEEARAEKGGRSRHGSAGRPRHGNGRWPLGRGPARPLEATERPDEAGPRHHVTLLAETPRGYANLCRLLTKSQVEGPGARGDPALPLEALLGRPEGLILLTGCRRSPLLAALERGMAEGEALGRRLLDAFGPGTRGGSPGLYVELQENAVHGDRERNRALCRLADRLGIPVVATGNVHYHRRARHRLQDVLVAIRHRTTVDDSHALRRPNACFHLASPAQVARRFDGRPDALASTLEIAERCAAFDLTEDLGYAFPDFEGSDRAPAIRVLAETCRAALEKRYPPGPAGSSRARDRAEAERRLETELLLVDRHGLAGFFLVYRDILELARDVARRVRGRDSPRTTLPPGRGRGSSVSSIICYLIGLSHVDPVQTNLYLGRFLNDAMGTVPDIDLDFARDIREELILAVYERYGSEHVGLVCTFPTYRTRSIVREVGKALSLPVGDIERLAKLAEPGEDGLAGELRRIPELREKADSPRWRAFAEIADEIRGLPRHISQHPGGMVISSRPLVELVPLEPAAWEGRVLCQWDKDSCEDAGFIKIDFLSLGMLSLVEEAVELIAERRGEAPDLSRIDYEDKAIYDRICSGDTVGLFQVESRAQIQMLRRVRPRSLADLAIQVAIVRPGPIVGGAVNPYVRRRERQRENPGYRVPYDHPLLEEALGETLGVIIFQDQVLQVCKRLAGFSDGQADGLRRAMSRKRSKEVMLGYWRAFLEGARERGVDDATAKKVFEQVVAFSEFGFPKSHAAAFGLLAYQSAWLRHHHRTEYYVALFNNQPMGFYSLDAIGRDARRHGVEVRLPDLNRSRVACTPEYGAGAEGEGCEGEEDVREGDRAGAESRGAGREALRVGLGFVREWGAEVAEAVVAERDRNGPYRSLPDFLRRTPAALGRAAIENLIWVGGMDSLGLGRRELLWQVGLWLGPETETAAERRRREAAGLEAGTGLAGLEAAGPVRGRRTTDRADRAQAELPLDEPYADLRFAGTGDRERLTAEYRILSFAASQHHPFALVRDRLPEGTVSSARFPMLPNGTEVRTAGLVVARQRPSTAKGTIFILMEDEEGPINAIVRPKVYEKHRAAIRLEPFLTIRGRLQKDGATYNVIAESVTALRLEAPLRPTEGGDRSEPASAGPSRRTGTPPSPMRSAADLPGPPPEVRRAGGGVPAVALPPDPDASPEAGPPAEEEPDPFRYLEALRRDPPPSMDWGRGGGCR